MADNQTRRAHVYSQGGAAMWSARELLIQARETKMTESELARRIEAALTDRHRKQFVLDLSRFIHGTLEGAPPDPESL